jgi:AcrR family transcriptional regulator
MVDKETKRPKRGRPAMSDKTKAEMRTQISTVASGLFKTEGFGNVSMRRIAKEIGCTPMSLYQYFDSKIDLLRSLWGDVFEALFARLEETSLSSDPTTRLWELGVGYVEFWLDNPESYRLVFMAEGISQPDVSLFLDNPNIVERYGVFLHGIASANASTLSDEQLKLRLDLLLSALHGIAHNHITISGYPWSPPREQIKMCMQAICSDKDET